MVTKRAVVMATRVVGKDAGNGKGGKSDGDGTKRVIARKRAMAGPIYNCNCNCNCFHHYDVLSLCAVCSYHE
jgi:hypothetical protein